MKITDNARAHHSSLLRADLCRGAVNKIRILRSCAGSMALAQLPSLVSLDLSNCERVDCQVLAHLAQAPVMHDLCLSGCAYIRDEGIQSVAALCKSLRRCDSCHGGLFLVSSGSLVMPLVQIAHNL